MTVRKRNEYLDIDDGSSDDEIERGYDSGAEDGRGATVLAHKHKRRKLDDGREEDQDQDQDLSDFSDDEEEGAGVGVGVGVGAGVTAAQPASTDSRFDSSRFAADDDDDEDDGDEKATSPPKKKPKKSKDLLAYESAHQKTKKSGVIYISRVPPFMKPHTLQHFLAPHAPHGLGRVFLTPEEHAQHARRVKNGGNKKKSFTDGWVEFVRKREAKGAVERLNGNVIGGRKGGFYHDDLWNLKYLRGFKWEHLTEQIRHENAERAARVREEVRRTRRENRRFVEDVERGKMLQGMERKVNAKLERGGGGGGGSGGDGGGSGAKDKESTARPKMKFKQNKSVEREGNQKGDKVAVAFGQAASVRSKIF
jgi:ESF2/ABP1 family protein